MGPHTPHGTPKAPIGTPYTPGPPTPPPQPPRCPLLLAGVHHVEVTFQELPVPHSPFMVAVAEGCDPTRVSAHGPGLESGLVGRANCFTVQTR